MGVPATRASDRSIITTASNLPADCVPKAPGPPGSPYQLGIVGTSSGGYLTAGPTRVANISVKFCGVITLVRGSGGCGVTGSVDSPSDGQIFGALSAQLTFIPGMQPTVPFTAHPGVITGTFKCAPPSSSGLAVTLDVHTSGTTGLFGLSCTIGPLSIELSGLVTGAFTDIHGTFTGTDISIPDVAPSSTCESGVAANLDEIASLPIRPGQGSISLPVTGSIYLPAS